MPASVSWEKPRSDGEDGAQVLVIDRDRDLVEMLAYALRRAGIDFLAAHDAASALETFAAQKPLMVVLDPYGLDVLEQLHASGGDTALIILTAGGSEDARVAALELGANDFLTKPFSCNELVASIHACLLRGRLDAPAHAFRVDSQQALGSRWLDRIGISRRLPRGLRPGIGLDRRGDRGTGAPLRRFRFRP